MVTSLLQPHEKNFTLDVRISPPMFLSTEILQQHRNRKKLLVSRSEGDAGFGWVVSRTPPGFPSKPASSSRGGCLTPGLRSASLAGRAPRRAELGVVVWSCAAAFTAGTPPQTPPCNIATPARPSPSLPPAALGEERISDGRQRTLFYLETQSAMNEGGGSFLRRFSVERLVGYHLDGHHPPSH